MRSKSPIAWSAGPVPNHTNLIRVTGFLRPEEDFQTCSWVITEVPRSRIADAIEDITLNLEIFRSAEISRSNVEKTPRPLTLSPASRWERLIRKILNALSWRLR